MEDSDRGNSTERPSKRTPQNDSATDEPFQPGLKSIPLDLINTIFLMLDLRTTCTLCLTCKQFHQFITSNNEIWKSLYISKHFLSNEWKPPQLSWREWLQRSMDARLYLWGSNKAGQLGSASSNSNVPIIAPELADSRIKCVSISGTQTIVVTDSNIVYHYGIKSSGGSKNNGGQILVALKDKHVHKVASGERHSVFLVSDTIDSHKYIIHWGRVSPDDTDETWSTLSNCPKDVVEVFCGRDFTALLDSEGKLWTYGSNTLGQLGTGIHTHWDHNPTKVNIPEPILLVALGREHMIMASATGLYGCGSNAESQLGIETEVDHITSYSTPVLVSTRRYKQITCGYLHSGGLTEQNEVFVWGDNSYGALGLGNVPRYFPTPQHVASLDSQKVVKLVGGGYHTHCLTAKGEVWSAGYNGAGQCAANDFSISPVFTKSNMLLGMTVIDLFASGFHTAGLFVKTASFQ